MSLLVGAITYLSLAGTPGLPPGNYDKSVSTRAYSETFTGLSPNGSSGKSYGTIDPKINEVYRDFTANYYIAEPAVQDFLVRYDIALSYEWATLEINGTVGLVAERLFSNQYDILSSVTQDFTVSYLLDGEPLPAPYPVYQDFTLIYSIDAEPTTYEVYQDFEVRWKMSGVVITDFECYYLLDGQISYADWQEEEIVDETWTPSSAVNGTWTTQTLVSTTWN